MDAILYPLVHVIVLAINLYIWVLIIAAVLSWLIAFNVVNPRNRFVYVVGDLCWRLTEPALRPLRRFVPNLGGIDLSFIALFLLLIFAKEVLLNLTVRSM